MKLLIHYDNFKTILFEFWRWMVGSPTLSTSDLAASAAPPPTHNHYLCSELREYIITD
jgi:hypothetical protein